MSDCKTGKSNFKHAWHHIDTPLRSTILPAQQLQMDLLAPLAVLKRDLNCVIIGTVKEDSSHSHLQMDYLIILISDMVQDFP